MNKRRLLLIVLLAFATALGLQQAQRFIAWARPLTLAIVLPGGHVTPAERALRPIYPYSVIPGGAYSPEELRRSMASDGIVRDHYKDFSLEATRLVTLNTDRFQYVSFRIKNKVYWTHRKLRIPKGEVLLTDGVHFARTRCGNRLCNSVAGPTFKLPSYKPLQLPPFTTELLSKGVTLPPAPTIAELVPGPGLEFELPRLAPYVPPTPVMPGPPENWPPVSVTPSPTPVTPGYPFTPPPPTTPVVPPTPPTSAIPEPASLCLFLVAFVMSGWLFLRHRREHSESAFDSREDGN